MPPSLLASGTGIPACLAASPTRATPRPPVPASSHCSGGLTPPSLLGSRTGTPACPLAQRPLAAYAYTALPLQLSPPRAAVPTSSHCSGGFTPPSSLRVGQAFLPVRFLAPPNPLPPAPSSRHGSAPSGVEGAATLLARHLCAGPRTSALLIIVLHVVLELGQGFSIRWDFAHDLAHHV
jgi:hypothetical protein